MASCHLSRVFTRLFHKAENFYKQNASAKRASGRNENEARRC